MIGWGRHTASHPHDVVTNLNVSITNLKLTMIGWGRQIRPLSLKYNTPKLFHSTASPKVGPRRPSLLLPRDNNGALKEAELSDHWPGGGGTGALHSDYPPNQLKYILRNWPGSALLSYPSSNFNILPPAAIVKHCRTSKHITKILYSI